MNETEQYIQAIKGNVGANVWFAAINDNNNQSGLIDIPGTYSAVEPELRRWNAKGYGIFMCINNLKKNATARNANNITEITYVFIDIDETGKTYEETYLPLEPSIVVETSLSGRKWHGYFKIKDCSVEQFRSLQQRLIAFYKSDNNIKDPCRVLRVPGFNHRKGEPVPVKLKKCDPSIEYTVQEIIDAHPVKDFKEKEKREFQTVATGDEAFSQFIEYAKNMKADEGDRHYTLKKLAIEGKANGFSPDQVYTAGELYAEVAGISGRLNGKEVEEVVKWVFEHIGDNWIPTRIDIYVENKMRTLVEELANADNMTPLRDKKNVSLIGQMNDIQFGSFAESCQETLGKKLKKSELNKIRKTAVAAHQTHLKRKAIAQHQGNGMTLIEDKSNYVETAKLFLRAKYESANLVWWAEDWWGYTGDRYEVIETPYLQSQLYKYLDTCIIDGKNGAEKYKPCTKTVSDVLNALKSLCIPHMGTEMPSWRDGAKVEPVIAFKNGLYQLAGGELQEHTNQWFSSSCLEYDYNPDAQCPNFVNTLNQWFPNSPKDIDTIQKMIGYLLTTRTELQKIFMLAGVPRSGKSTLTKVIKALIGKRNATSTSLVQLSGDYGMAGWIGKQLAVVNDAHSGSGVSQERVLDILKGVSGEDEMSINRKYKDAVDVRLQCRIVIVTNHAHEFHDPSGAMARRMVTVYFGRSFVGQEDHTLEEKLMNELPGIAIWALEGLKTLNGNGGAFDISEAGKDFQSDMEELSAPVKTFASQMLTFGTEETIEYDMAFETFGKWSHEENIKPMTKRAFLTELKSSGFGPILKTRLRDKKTGQSGSGGRKYYLKGVGLKVEGDCVNEITPVSHKDAGTDPCLVSGSGTENWPE